jgi:hypothetical protein
MVCGLRSYFGDYANRLSTRYCADGAAITIITDAVGKRFADIGSADAALKQQA